MAHLFRNLYTIGMSTFFPLTGLGAGPTGRAELADRLLTATAPEYVTEDLAGLTVRETGDHLGSFGSWASWPEVPVPVRVWVLRWHQ